jgi:ABC-type multidrug transport system ATPase subunit
MSEEILKALTQLFAIISKQDGGVSETERGFVLSYFSQELDKQTVQEYVQLYDKYAGYGVEEKENSNESLRKNKKTLTSVRDAVRTLALCRKINKTLNQKQKVIVLVKLLELLASDQAFTPQRMEIINTVSTVFNIPTAEYKLIERFVVEPDSSKLDSEDILIFDESKPPEGSQNNWIDSGLLDGEIIFIRVPSVNLYFIKYTGEDDISMNSQPIYKNAIVQFAPGSVIKTPKGAPLYYSDLVNKYNAEGQEDQISFNIEDVEFQFPNGHVGLRNINISEGPGSLIGIMGASGAGKTTLLNVLAGLEKPSQGSIKINGFDIHTQKDEIEGVIGYIAQDDLLIEELTVYQNLYYNAKLCFRDLTEEEIQTRVMGVLVSLGLDKIRDLVVGNVLNKKISGGQRKRLNIALELIREPAILFVDEPTSGLSSRDSENVIDLLKELSLKGKLIFVVIHQPSSDIYKMFDKMFLMDTGGYPIFYGNPVEAISYFKSASGQVSSERGQCVTCGNVNPEQLFNIIEARVVDEYGEFTQKRKVQPTEWHKLYNDTNKLDHIDDVKEKPPTNLKIPSKPKQTVIFTIRDFLSKISNQQYMFINLLEAPLLALLLSLVIRYHKESVEEYTYSLNDNIPAYILICIIIALFMGLTVSAEEIIKDRKILKRESFLNLSRSSYLVSKLLILFALSAVQTLSFVIIGNFVLDIEDLNMVYWLVLFSVSCHANVLGLNISSAFNSAITVYIIIPILLIPQLILSGLIFDYEKLNNSISTPGRVPIIADFMASRWAYEAISVEQFRSNPYQRNLFKYDLMQSQAKFKTNYWRPRLEDAINNSRFMVEEADNDSIKNIMRQDFALINNEFSSEPVIQEMELDWQSLLDVETFNDEKADKLIRVLDQVSEVYTAQLIANTNERDSAMLLLQESLPEEMTMSDFKELHYNESLEDVVKNSGSLNFFVVTDENRVVQLKDAVYNVPRLEGRTALNYRTHFFAPYKPLFGQLFPTFWFNVAAIWFMSVVLYLTLYFELLQKVITWIGNIGFKRLPKKSKE